MKFSERRSWVSGLVFTIAAVGVAHAHHSFSMFDGSKKIELHGTVVKFEWTNPHVWIQLLVDDPAGGAPKEWSIECPAVNGLARSGWTSRTLKVGDEITVFIHPLHAGGPGGALADAVLADGQHLGRTQQQIARDESAGSAPPGALPGAGPPPGGDGQQPPGARP